ncbi:hypothetical protein Rhe02_39060 [Rhizocola hellebori]|uniref:HNH endonuclease n=1 Tax=Rhizocola hellebori TaxID=1392758 RepID=A0A8J3Q9C1_9ACTN|nr:hypothetical protein [Rhizocola hellebori]GIH05839.1 hypothetical protein Rhe02_39060 [Rhizocola hellebori]
MSNMVDRTVRYVPGGDNKLLRHFMRLAWDLQCYWCRNYKDYASLEIDHILPQASNARERIRLRQAFGLPDDYDVHALYNLAPICGPCNKAKGAMDLTTVPVVINRLRKARRLAKGISKNVRRFPDQSALGGALLVAAQVDLDDPASRAVFEEGAPAVVQRLSELGTGKVDFHVFRRVEVEVREATHVFSLRLNEEARTAVAILERVGGGTLESALCMPLSDLLSCIAKAAESALEHHDDGMGAPDVESGEVELSNLVIDAVSYDGTTPGVMELGFAGEFEAWVIGTAARSSANGDELEYLQAEATATGRFSFSLVREPDDPIGEFVCDSVWLDEFAADTWMDGRRSAPWNYLTEDDDQP